MRYHACPSFHGLMLLPFYVHCSMHLIQDYWVVFFQVVNDEGAVGETTEEKVCSFIREQQAVGSSDRKARKYMFATQVIVLSIK